MKIEEKNAQWLKDNIHLYFLNNPLDDKKFVWNWSYNRLNETEKDEIVKIIMERRKDENKRID